MHATLIRYSTCRQEQVAVRSNSNTSSFGDYLFCASSRVNGYSRVDHPTVSTAQHASATRGPLGCVRPCSNARAFVARQNKDAVASANVQKHDMQLGLQHNSSKPASAEPPLSHMSHTSGLWSTSSGAGLLVKGRPAKDARDSTSSLWDMPGPKLHEQQNRP